jgi:hypothetical protein
MSFADELRAMRDIARRQMAGRALGKTLEDQGLDVDDGDPLRSLLRGAGLDVDGEELDGFYDAMLADLEEQGGGES